MKIEPTPGEWPSGYALTPLPRACATLAWFYSAPWPTFAPPLTSCADFGAGYHDLHLQPAEPDRCDRCDGTNFTRRADDTEETVRTLLIEYRAKTEPILEYYADRDILARVDGMGDMSATSFLSETIENRPSSGGGAGRSPFRRCHMQAAAAGCGRIEAGEAVVTAGRGCSKCGVVTRVFMLAR